MDAGRLTCPYCKKSNSIIPLASNPLQYVYECKGCGFELRREDREDSLNEVSQEELEKFWIEVFSIRRFMVLAHHESNEILIEPDKNEIPPILVFLEGDLSFSDAVAKKKEYEEKFGYQ